MEDVTLNGKPIPIEASIPTMLELVAAVEKQHVPEGWIVIEVVVGGRSLTEFTGADGNLIPYDPLVKVDIVTRDLSDIVSSSLLEFEKYLERLVPGLSEIAGLFRNGQIDSANQLYIEAIDGIRVMIELLQGISKTGAIDFERKKYHGKNLVEMSEDLRKALEKLVTAQTSGENEAIAAVLETDMTEELSAWYHLMPLLRSEFNNK